MFFSLRWFIVLSFELTDLRVHGFDLLAAGILYVTQALLQCRPVEL